MSFGQNYTPNVSGLELKDINDFDIIVEDIGNRVKVPMASTNSSIYKTSTVIVLRGKSITSQQKKKAEFLDFLEA